ncbi:unnamed protein product [Zymoseptoria tritici ST99CH_1E4]|uniref:FAD/NAD(P)-binding domain-containing protein n=1 Tax=Zymoseptoria tritici ST99CH_1E4 TaxID=1276532 RepID=A0A2H1GI74_ZYMTR|nr:unnamed protein product [Zymoseptoria tritici ST99CH_1E4]
MGSAAPALIDVLIVGGGPAGLAVATGLARQPYTAVVFESGVYRNARTNHMHNVVTWDHRDPADFRAKARADLWARYDTIRIEDAKIENIRWNGDGRFEAIDGKGNVWTGKKLALAVGMEDVYPDIPGYHCLFCDGYEDRGVESAGILALGELGTLRPAVQTARMAKRLTSSVTIYTDGDSELESQIRNVLGKDSVFEMDNRQVTRLEKVKGKLQRSLCISRMDQRWCTASWLTKPTACWHIGGITAGGH